MFKRKKSLPTWIQNVDLGQKREYDRSWIFIVILFFLFFVVCLLGIYAYPFSGNDYFVFERVNSIFLSQN
ncbi:MAG: hypothetical protein GX432_03535 [Candidatus Atribacteria bacterium]|jgi:hypothetical protein|nr:hypothetical protein [Candidatus Atribacteria bacterium]